MHPHGERLAGIAIDHTDFQLPGSEQRRGTGQRNQEKHGRETQIHKPPEYKKIILNSSMAKRMKISVLDASNRCDLE